MNNVEFLVCVKCLTFNHAAFIEDALNGFCMQETSFPFLCTIIDDASTDGEQEVIKSYLQKHFNMENKCSPYSKETEDYSYTFAQHKVNKNCYFAVYYLKYNHYSKRKSKGCYVTESSKNVKYIALCEGDDYWISKQKLECQIRFMENNPEYVMSCNKTLLFSVKRNAIIGENFCYLKNKKIEPKDVIKRGGLFISTCSIVYRKSVEDNKPEYWKKCKIGDQPLQIACLLKGRAFFFNESMSVYRVENSNSWMGNQQWGAVTDQRIDIIKSQINMLKGFSCDYPRYGDLFRDKIAEQINNSIPNRRRPKKEVDYYLKAFSDDIKQYDFKWKIDLIIRKCRIPVIRAIYTRLLFPKYRQKKISYNM